MIWQFFEQLNQWHWFILGLLLLIGEALGASGFLLGTAIAAFITGVLTAVLGDSLSWQGQILTGAILAVICSVLYWKKFRAEEQKSDRPELNQRTAQFIGRRLVLSQDIEFQGRVQIGDTFWKVTSNEHLKEGEHVVVVSVDATTLTLARDQ